MAHPTHLPDTSDADGAALVDLARARPPMTVSERKEQARNFAAGNIGLENERVTRAVVDEAERRFARRPR